GLGGCPRPFLLHQPRERLAVDELHPDPDLVANLHRAMDRDDVGMADACEELPFAQDGGERVGTVVGAGLDDLERDFAREPRLPGAIDDAEAAAPDLLEDLQRPPRVIVPTGRLAAGDRIVTHSAEYTVSGAVLTGERCSLASVLAGAQANDVHWPVSS